MTNTTYIDNYADSVSRILQRHSFDQNDFVSLAIAGEQLRRALALAEKEHADAHSVLRSYDAFLAQYRGEIPTNTVESCCGVLEDLEAYAAQQQSVQDGEDLLCELDQVFCVAVACARTGADVDVAGLARNAKERCQAMAYQFPELAQFAENRELLFGPDPDYPAFVWWEAFAELAPTRVALFCVIAAEARRQRILDQVLSAWDVSDRDDV